MNRPGARLVAVFTALLVVLAFAAAPASASITHHKLGSFNGSGAPAGPLGPILPSAAVDNTPSGPSSGDVYVAESNAFGVGQNLVDKFEADGEYAGVQITGATTPAASFAFGLHSGIAVDSSTGPNTGDLYVADTGNGVVDRFSESGAFQCQITGKTPVSAAEIAHECNGAAGSLVPGGGSITPGGVAVNSANGDLYVADDAHGVIDEFAPSGEYLTQVTSSYLASGGEMSPIALDSLGNLYVNVEAGGAGGSGYVVELDPAGHFVRQLSGSHSGSWSVSVNPATDEVYVSESSHEGTEQRISEYEDGALIGVIPTPESLVLGLAVDAASGKLYATELSFATFESSVSIYGPDIGIPTVTALPATNQTETSATVNGHVDPDAARGGTEVTSCTFEYVKASEYEPQEPNPYALGETKACSPTTPYTTARDVSAGLTGLSPATAYHYRLVAESALGKSESEDEAFFSAGLPAIEAGSENSYVSGVSATLRAKVNPFGFDTACQVSYVTEADFQTSEWAEASTQPCSPEDLGSAFGYQSAVATLEGLKVGTTYHYRFLATHSAPAGTGAGEDKTFVTFGVHSVEFEIINEEGEGHPFTEAGGHPYEMRTGFKVNETENVVGPHTEVPTGNLKSVVTELPAGLIGAPSAIPQCSRQSLSEFRCSGAAQVGVMSLTLEQPGTGFGNEGILPIFNIKPPRGIAAEFAGSFLQHVNIFIDAKLRPDGNYAVTAESPNNSNVAGVSEVYVHLWGVPNDPGHNAQRFCTEPSGRGYEQGCTTVEPMKPFLADPTSCGGPLTTMLAFNSWQTPGLFDEHALETAPITGCNQLEFEPTLEARPTTNLADSPSGLAVDLHIPQNNACNAGPPVTCLPEEADLRDTKVVLPQGIAVNPAAASGLEACSSAQIGLKSAPGATPVRFSGAPANCPDASKIGKVEVDTPLLSEHNDAGQPTGTHPLPGAVYIAKPHDNPFDSLLAIYVAIDDPETGIVVKLAGHVEADPQTGQLTTTFQESPQVPFEDFKLEFFKGAHAALRTPPTCGAYRTTSVLTPWSFPEGARKTPSDPYQITAAPGGGACPATQAEERHSPGFEAGTESPTAGAFSPFILHLARADDSQELKGINTVLPPGLTGKLAGVAECPNAAIEAAEHKSGAAEQASPSCPASSQLGIVNVGAGAGPAPYYVQGKAYLAGPYKGAPLSLAIVTPAVAGPFDLGTVVVKAALLVNPETAQITAKSDPIPTILQGIPLDVRSIAVKLDRNQFSLNPTSCEKMAVGGEALSILNQSASLTDPFQVGGCSALPFGPKLKLSLKGKTNRAGNPALKAVLTAKPGEANVAGAQVTLPHSEFLDNAHIKTVCTRVQFSANECPAASIYGHATAITPLLDQPLSGPVYLRSSSNKLPDLVAALNGQINVDLDGRIDTGKGGGIRNSFEVVPDAPVSKFVLEMQGGNKGLLENSENLCSPQAKTHAIVNFTGQNGKISNTTPAVANSCKTKHKKHGKHHKRHRRAG